MAAPPEPAEVHFALRLRKLREDAHLTQSQLASIFSVENQVGAASISSWENQRRPSPVPESRLEPYARLFSAPSPEATGKLALVPVDKLDPSHAAACDDLFDELHDLWDTARGGSASLPNGRDSGFRSWFFDDGGPAVIVAPDAPPDARSPLASTGNPNYTALLEYADLDALIELYGHIRAENESTFPVWFTKASRVEANDLSGHLVLLGGIGWNTLTRQLLRSLPAASSSTVRH